MFSKLRNALSPSSPDVRMSSMSTSSGSSQSPPRYSYGRPTFLNLGLEQINASSDHAMRPIIAPNSDHKLVYGYAECINAGKSKWNEDQAVHFHGELNTGGHIIPYEYFGLFDGHAGVGAALYAARQLHHLIHEKLVDAQDDIEQKFDNGDKVFVDALVMGAIEVAFKEMDEIIKEERTSFLNMGGCTALVALFILQRLYVANAGDSRAIVCDSKGHLSMSKDFTPESEKKRIRELAQLKPKLLCHEFNYMEYERQPKTADLGRRVLYRDAFMQGWSYKTVEAKDTKPAIITGDGKRSRLMGTIGVTRGFGDHDLVSVFQKRVAIKPFLSSHPEIMVYNVDIPEQDMILVMGTDGLWDVLDGIDICKILKKHIRTFQEKEKYICAATQIIGAARGTLRDHLWVMKNGKSASLDDISVFVVPIAQNKSLWVKKQSKMRMGEKSDTRKKRSNSPKPVYDEQPARRSTSVEDFWAAMRPPPRSESPKERRVYPKTPYPKELLKKRNLFPDLPANPPKEEKEEFLSFAEKFEQFSEPEDSKHGIEVIPDYPNFPKLMVSTPTIKTEMSSTVVTKKRKSPEISPTSARKYSSKSFAELAQFDQLASTSTCKRYKLRSCTAKYSTKKTRNSLQIRRTSYFETKAGAKKRTRKSKRLAKTNEDPEDDSDEPMQ